MNCASMESAAGKMKGDPCRHVGNDKKKRKLNPMRDPPFSSAGSLVKNEVSKWRNNEPL